MGQFRQITHTHMYVVPFHTLKVFTTLRVNSLSFSGRTIPLFDSMLVHQGEGSGTPTEPHHTPFPEAQQSSPTAPSSPSLPPATTETIPTMATKITAQDLEIASLKARINMLEDRDAEGAEPSREDATIKGKSLETGEEAGVERSTERGSNDTEELVNVLTSLDAASILTSGVQVVSVLPAAEIANVSVPTGSGMVPTAVGNKML
nr:hypothetical protein [Tanacetum cinerariifolium]